MKNTIKKTLFTAPLSATLLLMAASADPTAPAAAAGGLGVLESGTIQLITDVSSALQKIVGIAGGAAVCYCFIRKSMADDVDQKKWQSRIITSVIATVGGLIATTLITVVAGYYGS